MATTLNQISIGSKASSKRIEITYTSGDQDKVAAETSARSIDQVIIDNTNGTADVYLRLYDVASGSVTLGTTVPDAILPCSAGESIEYSFHPGNAWGTAITANLTTSTTASAYVAVTWTAYITLLTSS
jgi:hypothetical protein|tara:strand:+ start:2406 stop:2789 length:384 start_codon:yes stop_codon:yes gene_type:complete